MLAELMAGAVVAVEPRRVVMALATFVCTAASSPAASVMSPLAPVLSKVDHSPAAGSALNVSVPLPLGPTEMAAWAPMQQAMAITVRAKQDRFIIEVGWRDNGPEYRVVRIFQ